MLIDTVFVSKVLSSTSSFTYDIAVTLPRVDRVIVKSIDYYGGGSDNDIHFLRSSLLSGRTLAYFKESRGTQSSPSNFIFNISNFGANTSYSFTISGLDGVADSLSGEIVIVLEFQMLDV